MEEGYKTLLRLLFCFFDDKAHGCLLLPPFKINKKESLFLPFLSCGYDL